MPQPTDAMNTNVSFANMAFFSWDLAADKVYGDACLADLFHLKADDLAAGYPIVPMLERIAQEDRSRIAKSIQQAIVSGTRYEERYRILHPTRGTISVLGTGRCLRDANGTPSIYNGAVIETACEPVFAGSDALELHCRSALELAKMSGNELAARYLSSALRVIGCPTSASGRSR